MSKDDIKLTREELYAKVWSKPATELAKEFGISDVAIGKICKKMNVPKPGPGYWRRLEVGERPQLIPLPKQQDRLPQLVFIEPHLNPSTFKSMAQEVLDRIQAESDPANQITVGDSLRKAHPLVKAAQLELEHRRKSGAESIWSPQEPCLDIRVSRKSMRRALLIMDALLKALEARGYSVELGTRDRHCTKVVVGQDQVRVYLTEKYDTKKDEPNVPTQRELLAQTQEPSPSSRLVFTIDEFWPHGGRKNWTDGKRRTLEEQLNEVVAGILTVAEALRVRRVEREEEEKRRLEARRRWEEQERLRKKEEDRRNALDLQVAHWVKSNNLRAFLARCEKVVQSSVSPIVPDGPEARWLAWARNYADQLDPLGKPAIVTRLAFDAEEQE